MANEEHLVRLRQGVEVWNAWLKTQRALPKFDGVDLNRADLRAANLSGTDLGGADLSGADLRGADLRGTDLSGADLRGTDLSGADLGGTDLSLADLRGADLSGAELRFTNLSAAYLREADLRGTVLGETLFIDVDLSSSRGLAHCDHRAPSTVDHRSLQRSGPLPLTFLRGCGLPDNWIEYLPSLLNQAIQHYSCFISYSSKDQDFANRLHADLQNEGVRCWFAPHDLPIGAKTWDAIDAAIKLRDKLLLILSENAIASDWVEDEVGKAFAEERDRKGLVLFPVRIDNAVMTTAEPWAVKLRDQRNVGDFRKWREHDGYQKSLGRLLRDLTMPASKPSA